MFGVSSGIMRKALVWMADFRDNFLATMTHWRLERPFQNLEGISEASDRANSGEQRRGAWKARSPLNLDLDLL